MKLFTFPIATFATPSLARSTAELIAHYLADDCTHTRWLASSLQSRGLDVGRLVDDFGRVSLAAICLSYGATVDREWCDDKMCSYVFDDGSAIVQVDNEWDIRADSCPSYCYANSGCNCH